ncbi:hypothetical protein ACOMHN_015575 [Nucella lapillus]
MSLLFGLVARAFVLSVSCLYGVGAVMNILFTVIKLGPRTMLKQKKRSSPPTCLLDEKLGRHGYVYLEDIRMHYVSNGDDDKPLMLLLHGFPEFWYSWRHQLKEFNDHYRVVAVDLRGYGETDKPSGMGNYALHLLVEDIRQFITALGCQQCVLVGHDWGGAISWALAAKHPDLVSHLVILNCPDIQSFRKHLMGSFTQFKRSWYMFLFQLPWLPEFLIRMNDFHSLGATFKGRTMGAKSEYFTDDDLEAYKYNFSRNSLTEPINYIRAALSLRVLSGGGASEKRGPRDVTMPTLIVWGEKDGALDKSLAAMASQRCKSTVTIKYIENCSHWVQMDRPDLVNRYIREFLSRE